MADQLSSPSVIVNNVPVAIIPNTLVFNEGLGEQNMRATSSGGNEVEQVYSDNVEMRSGKVKFEIAPTIENIALARAWKLNRNANLVQVSGRTADGTLTRTFAQAGLLNDYEVPLGADTNIALEFTSKPAV